MNLPIPYEVENLIASCFTPGDVQLRNNLSYRFFCRYLWDKILEKAVERYTRLIALGKEGGLKDKRLRIV